MNHYPAVRFVAPYRVYVPDEFFKVLVGRHSAQVKALPLPPITNTGASHVHGQNIEVAHDIFGFAGRTQFNVVLTEFVDIDHPDWKKQVCSRDHEYVEAALSAVNRFLAVYRDQDTNRVGVPSFHVIELVRDDLSDISLVVVDEDMNRIGNFAVSWPGFRSMGFGDATRRAPSIVNAIRDYLASDTEIPIERELMTSAQNHLRRRQLRLVPIEVNTAFESYTYSALVKAAPRTTLPDSSSVFDKLQALESVFVSAAASSSRRFSRWFDPAVQGWRGLICAELIGWHRDCYELRNRVIHRGYSAVTSVEADRAIKRTQVAIGMIDQCVATLVS